MRIAFDAKLMRPACVILQAAFGCGPSIAHRFPTTSWLLAPTPDMHVYEIDEDNLKKLVQRVKEKL